MLAQHEIPLRYSSRTVLVVDDSELVRSSLSAFISGHPGMVVSATAANARSAIEMADAMHPDIALLDMNMPGGGTRAATGIHSVWPRARMLALTVRRDEQSVISMLQAGVSGYLLKGTRPQKILTGMEHVLKGRAVLSPELGRHVAQRLAVINGRVPVNRDFERDPVLVLAVDDDPGVLEAVDALINGEPGMRLVGTATNVEDAIELASTTHPDVALIDVRMPDWGGERVVFEMARVAPATRISNPAPPTPTRPSRNHYGKTRPIASRWRRRRFAQPAARRDPGRERRSAGRPGPSPAVEGACSSRGG